MSNRQWDDSVQFIEEIEGIAKDRKLKMKQDTCTLETISESKESEQGKDDSKSLESGTETLLWDFDVFSFCGMFLSVMEDFVILWEEGSLFLEDMTGLDGLCDEGLGKDDEG
jgi:hypothetical protein